MRKIVFLLLIGMLMLNFANAESLIYGSKTYCSNDTLVKESWVYNWTGTEWINETRFYEVPCDYGCNENFKSCNLNSNATLLVLLGVFSLVAYGIYKRLIYV